MKPQCSCLTMFGQRAYGVPLLAGVWWRPEDVARLLRLLVRPLLIAIVLVTVAASLLFGGRSVAPFVIGGGIGNPGQMASMSAERASAERDLRAESARLLESFESANPSVLPGNGELP